MGRSSRLLMEGVHGACPPHGIVDLTPQGQGTFRPNILHVTLASRPRACKNALEGKEGTVADVTRFGVSLEERLLEQFDRLITRKGYTNRSEAIRDLIRDNLVREQWETGTAEMVGTITLVYDHETRELTDKLTDLQHDHFDRIVSTLHVHLDAHHCLEVMVVRGQAAELKKIADKLIGTRGVKHGTFSATAEGKALA